jgi:hypothetical protein
MIDISQVKFESGIEVYVFSGHTHQGKKFEPVRINLAESPEDALCIIFDLMMQGKTVMFIRREENGILYSTDTHGPDLFTTVTK